MIFPSFLVLIVVTRHGLCSTVALDHTLVVSDLLSDLTQSQKVSGLVNCALSCSNYEGNDTCRTVDLGESGKACGLGGIRQNLTLDDVGRLDLTKTEKKYTLRGGGDDILA